MKIVSFARRLRKVRKSLKLNQSELADLLSCDRQKISYVESEGKDVYFLTIDNIAKILNLIPIGFYFYDDENKKWILDTLDNEKFWEGTLENYIGRILEKYRIKKGLSQKKLAEIINISSPTINRHEGGKIMPSSRILKKECSFLGIVPHYLLEKSYLP